MASKDDKLNGVDASWPHPDLPNVTIRFVGQLEYSNRPVEGGEEWSKVDLTSFEKLKELYGEKTLEISAYLYGGYDLMNVYDDDDVETVQEGNTLYLRLKVTY